MIESPHVASDYSNCLCLLMVKFGWLERGEKGGAFQSFNKATMWGIQGKRGIKRYDGLLRSGNISFSPHASILPALGV